MPAQNIHQVIELTAEGVAELTQELQELEEEKIPVAVQRVATARSYGDLSENAEYHDAKDDLEFLETRRDEIKEILLKAKVVKATKSRVSVGMGSTVVIKNLDTGKQSTVTIVGEFEADPVTGKISSVSPMGKALMGKKKDTEVTVLAPAGEIAYNILEIK